MVLSALPSLSQASDVLPRAHVNLVNRRSQKEQQLTVLNEETYYKVLDLAFPRPLLNDPNLRYIFILRFEPTFAAESQITIAERQGKIEVIKYTAADGSIELRLNKIVQRTRRQDPTRMARQIRIKKERLTLSPDDLKRLHDSFFENLRLSENTWLEPLRNEIMITSDGTHYRVWYRGETEVQSDFIGSNLTTPTRRDESPLIEWMKSVYLKVTSSTATAHR